VAAVVVVTLVVVLAWATGTAVVLALVVVAVVVLAAEGGAISEDLPRGVILPFKSDDRKYKKRIIVDTREKAHLTRKKKKKTD
jgi:hypothetical protein